MTRIDQTFKKLKSEGKKAFVSYIMAGDPDLKTSAQILLKLQDQGADIIELGFPFSDPIADGPIIQMASTESLNNGTQIERFFSIVTSNGYFHFYCHDSVK